MANIVYIATSLDGFIASQDGGIDWLMNIPNPTGSDYGYAEFIEDIDAIVMGRNTFEKVLTLVDKWPYTKPVVVLSQTLQSLPDSLPDTVELMNLDVKRVIHRLHEKGYTNLYIDGGRVIQHFLREDLIDTLIITRVPIVLGGGYPLFDTLDQPLRFRLAGHEVYNDTLVKSTYVRDRTE